MQSIWERDSVMEFHDCDAPEELTLSRAYLERLFRDHAGTGIMAHAWPHFSFYEEVLQELNSTIVETTTQCRLKAYYRYDIERLVCHNGTCVQCSSINPSVSLLLNEACHDLRSPTGKPDPSRVVTVKKEEELVISNSSDDCGWLNYNEAITLYNKTKLDGEKFNFLGRCDASPGLVLGAAYLAKLKDKIHFDQNNKIKKKDSSNKTYRRFFEDKLQVVRDDTNEARFRSAIFCHPDVREDSVPPKLEERTPSGYTFAVVGRWGPRVCGPDRACVECNDTKESDGMMYEACHTKDIVYQAEYKERIGSSAPSNSAAEGLGKKPFTAVGLAVFAALYW